MEASYCYTNEGTFAISPEVLDWHPRTIMNKNIMVEHKLDPKGLRVLTVIQQYYLVKTRKYIAFKSNSASV